MNKAAGMRHSRHDQHASVAALLPDFAHMQRHWEPTYKTYAVKLLPGEYYATARDEMLMTVLGSCISACIRDTVYGIGGMNHFMLPVGSRDTVERWHTGGVSAAARYGNYAMELLINAILKHGGRRPHLEVKIFGGGRILGHMTDIGRHNITFVHAYIRTEALQLVAEDVSDVYPRKILYFPASGRVRVKKLRALRTDAIARRETAYLRTLESRPIGGDIELF